MQKINFVNETFSEVRMYVKLATQKGRNSLNQFSLYFHDHIKHTEMISKFKHKH